MRSRSRFQPSRFCRARLIELERRVEFLEGERGRLERVLSAALEVAVAGTGSDPIALLGVLCELSQTNPARAAFLEERGS
jgi:hypothetical protein